MRELVTFRSVSPDACCVCVCRCCVPLMSCCLVSLCHAPLCCCFYAIAQHFPPKRILPPAPPQKHTQQVATDTRLWLYSQLIDIRVSLQELITVATNRAEAEADVLMPGVWLGWISQLVVVEVVQSASWARDIQQALANGVSGALQRACSHSSSPTLSLLHSPNCTPPTPSKHTHMPHTHKHTFTPHHNRIHAPPAGADSALGPLAHVTRRSMAA